jgi:hypothetical protein
MKYSQLRQIIKEEILKELDIKKKTSIGSGYEQDVYPYIKDPNYVIKKWYNKDHTEGSIERFISMYNEYPKYIARSFKLKDNHDYYFQEKIDNDKFKQDVINEFNIFIKNLYNYYKDHSADELEEISNEYDSWGDSGLSYIFMKMAEDNVKPEDLKFNGSLDDFGNGPYSSPMHILVPKYDSIDITKFITNKKLYSQLKKIVPLGDDITITGVFHEGNLGYDKNGDLKIIDI